MVLAIGQPIGQPRTDPVALLFAWILLADADNHGHRPALRARQQQHFVSFSLEAVSRGPVARRLFLSRPPLLELIFVEQVQRNGNGGHDGADR